MHQTSALEKPQRRAKYRGDGEQHFSAWYDDGSTIDWTSTNGPHLTGHLPHRMKRAKTNDAKACIHLIRQANSTTLLLSAQIGLQNSFFAKNPRSTRHMGLTDHVPAISDCCGTRNRRSLHMSGEQTHHRPPFPPHPFRLPSLEQLPRSWARARKAEGPAPESGAPAAAAPAPFAPRPKADLAAGAPPLPRAAASAVAAPRENSRAGGW